MKSTVTLVCLKKWRTRFHAVLNGTVDWVSGKYSSDLSVQQHTARALHTYFATKMYIYTICTNSTIAMTAAAFWKKSRFDECVLQGISGACVDTKPRGIKKICIFSGDRNAATWVCVPSWEDGAHQEDSEKTLSHCLQPSHYSSSMLHLTCWRTSSHLDCQWHVVFCVG